MYKKVFEFILYLIQHSVSSEPTVLDHEKKWKHDKETLDVIDTTYGFNIDRWDISVKCLDYILAWIPIYDEEPTIDPTVNIKTLNEEYGKYITSESVEINSLIDFLINNTGSYFVKDGVADFSALEKYEVRPSFEKYGGIVFINKDNQIDHYEYLGVRYEADNKKIEQIIWASMGFILMVKLHALRIHLTTSQKVVYYLYEKYDKNHDIADLLQLITYDCLNVNRRIPILVSDHGIVARLFSFTNESFNQLLHDTLQESWLSREELLGNPGTVWYDQISRYATLVDDFIDTFNISDEEKHFISDFFIASSACHNQWGDSMLYSQTISNKFLPKIYAEHPGFVSKLDQTLLITLLMSVSGNHPLCVDPMTDNVFTNKVQREQWKKFRERLISEYSGKKLWLDGMKLEISVGF
jgi:hypothetical protein